MMERVLSHKDRWQTVQPCPASCLHKNTGDEENGSALVANNAVDMQQIVDRFSSAAHTFGLKIDISKTELLYQPPPMSIELPETITVHDEPLKTTESFTYLGSTVTNTNSAELEVERRIQSATKAYVALQKKLWSYNDNNTKTKVKVYSVAVIPCLLYSIEGTTLYRRHIVALTSLQLRHIRCTTSSTSSGKTLSQALRYCAVLTQSVLKP